jgi:hypothetical protein
MNNNLSFHRSLITSFQSKINFNYWDTVLRFYDEKNYAETVRGVIRYLDPAIETRYANADKTAYAVPHGSAIINITISADQLILEAPFLSIGGSKLVPLLRQVAQINFSPLTLSQVRLHDEQLAFIYSSPLELCEPLKVYDVLREICINADNYDDEFITKFNAVRIREPQIHPYDTAKTDQAWERVQQYIQEAFTAYEQLENKRLNQFLWDLLIITLLKTDLLCAPQGNLRNEIEKNISYLNSKEDYYQRLNTGREFLKKLQAMPKEHFVKDLYSIDVLVPYKFFTTLDSIRNSLKYAYETSSNERKANDFMGATFTLEYGILNLFYNNTMDDAIANILMTALERSSAKNWNEASTILYDAVDQVMTNTTFTNVSAPVSAQTKKESEKGFFEKLFGL